MPANLSRPGDPDPSRSTQAVALQDPDLLDSIVNEYAVSAKRERRYHEKPGTGKPRYFRRFRQPAFDPMRHRFVQTGFTS